MQKKGTGIFMRKDGRWEGRIYLGGDSTGKRKYQSVYGSTFHEAEEKLINKRLAIDNNRIEEPKEQVILFDALVEQWLINKKLEVKLTTYSTYLRLLECQILPIFKNTPLKEIDSNLIRRFLNDKVINGRSDGGGGLSKKTLRDIQIILNNIFKFAETEYDCINPCKNIKLLRTSQKEMILLEEQERITLTNYLLKNLTNDLMGILISMYMGVRLGEICALKWNNIDLEYKIIKIRATVSRIIDIERRSKSKTKLIIDSPKSASSIRNIPIPDLLMEPLKKLSTLNHNTNSFLLSGNTEQCREPSTYRKLFKQILVDSGIPNIPYHSLRHGFATMCVNLGFDTKSLSEILGHASVTITLDRYVHSSFQYKQEQMKKLSKYATV